MRLPAPSHDARRRSRHFHHLLAEIRSSFVLAILIAALACPAYSPATTTTISNNTSVPGGTIASGDEWDVQSGVTLTNRGTLTTSGSSILNNTGVFTNEYGAAIIGDGLLINSDGGSMDNSGNMNVRSVLNNYNLFTNEATGTINIFYAFHNGNSFRSGNAVSTTNNGTINIFLGAAISNQGIFTNTGTLNNNATILNDVYGTLNNRGSITNNKIFINNNIVNNNAGTIDNYGTLVNKSGGTLNNYATLQNESRGVLENNGIFNNQAELTNLSGGMLTNNSVLKHIAGSLNNYGTLTNAISGTIQSNSTFTNYSTGQLINNNYFYNYNTLNNTSGGVLTNNSEFKNIEGQINNFGTVTNSQNAWLDNSGSFANNSGGTLNNNGTLVNAGILLNNDRATLNNNNSLYNRLDHVITNTGELNNSGSLDNQGTIVNAIDNASGLFTVKKGGVYYGYANSSLHGGTLAVMSGGKLAVASGAVVDVHDLVLSAGGSYVILFSDSGEVTLKGRVQLLSDRDTYTLGTLTKITDGILYTATLTAVNGADTATITSTPKNLSGVMGGNGAALDTVRASAAPGSAVAGFFNTLGTSTDLGQVQTALRQATGEGVVNSGQLVLGATQVFHGAIGLQVATLGQGSHLTPLAAGFWSTAGQAEGLPDGADGLMTTLAQIASMNGVQNNVAGEQNVLNSLSMRGQAQWLHQGARGGRGGYDADMGLAALGYDTPLSDTARIGIAMGFSSGQSRATGVKTDVKSWFLGPYGTWRLGFVTLDADAAYTYSHGSMKGSYSFPYVDSTSGDFDANTLSANLLASHTFGFADDTIRLIPSVGIEAAYSARDAFTESGSSITRRYAAGETTSVGVPIGAALQRDVLIANKTVTPELSLYYVRELADTAPTARVTLLDSTVSSSTKGADAGRDLWRAGFGVHANLGDGFDASARYTGEFGDRYSNNGAELLLQYAF